MIIVPPDGYFDDDTPYWMLTSNQILYARNGQLYVPEDYPLEAEALEEDAWKVLAVVAACQRQRSINA